MNTKDKIIVGLVGMAVILTGISLGASLKKTGMLSADLTVNPSTDSYTDSGADLRQNVQAIAERMAGLSQYQVLQADSNGLMQVVNSLSNLRIESSVKSGSIATFTATSTATAANVCDNPLWAVTPASTTPTITMPATTTLFADCLTTNGDSVSFAVKTNTTSTILGVGTGGNLDLDASATITADKSAEVTIIRDSATTYLMQVDNYNS